MVYLQFDHEFDEMLIRVIWVGKHSYNRISRELNTEDYKVLAELYDGSAGGNPEVWEIMDGISGPNDEFWPDWQAWDWIFTKIFADGNDWPEIKFNG
jgi:hypothetical protein